MRLKRWLLWLRSSTERQNQSNEGCPQLAINAVKESYIFTSFTAGLVAHES
jgi:hypothetical protein